MPTVEIASLGFVELSDLDPDGVPTGTIVLTSDGSYYRLANSTADLSPAQPLAAPPGVNAIADLKLAASGNEFEVIRQPDVPRNLTVTTSAAGYDGGPISILGYLDGSPVSDLIVPSPLLAATVAGTQRFDRIERPSKETVGTSSVAVSIGTGALLATRSAPLVVAVRGDASKRWLLASDEVVLPAVTRLYLYSDGAYRQGVASTLQGLVDSFDSRIRSLVKVMEDGGLRVGELGDFVRASRT